MQRLTRLLDRLVAVERPATGAVKPEHPGWPEFSETVEVPGDPTRTMRLRPLRRDDRDAWQACSHDNRAWTEPYLPTLEQPWEQAYGDAGWKAYYEGLRREAFTGKSIPWAIEVDGEFAGEMQVESIAGKPELSAAIGYWVDYRLTGLGIASMSCALAVDHLFDRVGLHRVWATYDPTNAASGAVLHAVGFRDEGLLRKNLHINGTWRDHTLAALVREDLGEQSCVERYKERMRRRRA